MNPSIVSRQDVTLLGGIAALSTIAWTVPERYWSSISHRLGKLAIDSIADDPERVQQAIRQAVGDQSMPLTVDRILGELASEQILSKLQILKSYRPGGWQPTIHLEGSEQIERGLQAGQGVILWIGHFVGSNLVAKMALHQAGWAVHHLSSVQHGFDSTTWLGLHYLNRVQTAIEDRYLAERILLSTPHPVQAMLTLADRLRHNQIVSITAHQLAKNPAQVPFLAGCLSLAMGAPTLAHSTQSTLLPVFPVREATGRWQVIVEAPIDIPPHLPLRQAMTEAAQRYAALLEPYVLRYPGQWMGWLRELTAPLNATTG